MTVTKFVDDEFLKERFEQGINVIGNAQSLLQKNYGGIIDERYTVRFNWPELNKFTGNRLDSIVCSLPEHIPSSYQVDLLISKNTKTRPNSNYQYVIPKQIIDDAQHLVDSTTDNKKPSNGFLLLYLLDKIGQEDVSIFGFDWKNTPSTTSKPNGKISTKQNDHDFESERRIIIKMIRTNNWNLYR